MTLIDLKMDCTSRCTTGSWQLAFLFISTVLTETADFWCELTHHQCSENPCRMDVKTRMSQTMTPQSHTVCRNNANCDSQQSTANASYVSANKRIPRTNGCWWKHRHAVTVQRKCHHQSDYHQCRPALAQLLTTYDHNDSTQQHANTKHTRRETERGGGWRRGRVVCWLWTCTDTESINQSRITSYMTWLPPLSPRESLCIQCSQERRNSSSRSGDGNTPQIHCRPDCHSEADSTTETWISETMLGCMLWTFAPHLTLSTGQHCGCYSSLVAHRRNSLIWWKISIY